MCSLPITGTFSRSFSEIDRVTLLADINSNKVTLGAGVYLPGCCAYKDNVPKTFCSISSADLGLGPQPVYSDVYATLMQQGGSTLHWSDQFRLALPGIRDQLTGCAILLLERPLELEGEQYLPALHFGEQLRMQPISLAVEVKWPEDVHFVCAV